MNNTDFPKIVITDNVLWGQPRIIGRRHTVCRDVVSFIMSNESLNFTLEDYQLSMQEIKQALHYCKLKQCIKDNPKMFCHNCTLSVNQKNEKVENEKENWKVANILIKKHFE